MRLVNFKMRFYSVMIKSLNANLFYGIILNVILVHNIVNLCFKVSKMVYLQYDCFTYFIEIELDNKESVNFKPN